MPRSRRLSYIEAVNILDISNEESEYDESDLDYCADSECSEIESSEDELVEDESVEDNQVDIQQFHSKSGVSWSSMSDGEETRIRNRVNFSKKSGPTSYATSRVDGSALSAFFCIIDMRS